MYIVAISCKHANDKEPIEGKTIRNNKGNLYILTDYLLEQARCNRYLYSITYSVLEKAINKVFYVDIEKDDTGKIIALKADRQILEVIHQ